MDALLRRLECRSTGQPADRVAAGRGAGARPLRHPAAGLGLAALSHGSPGVDPIDAPCDCPDFLKNSLGVCKHVLVVLEHLHARPRLLAAGPKGAGVERTRHATAGLCWDPIRPLTGFGDWLERVTWRGNARGGQVALDAGRPGRCRWFRSSKDGVATLKNSHLATSPPSGSSWSRTCSRSSPVASVNGSMHDPALRALLVSERDRLKRLVNETLERRRDRGRLSRG